MPSKVMILNGSPKAEGNTSILIQWLGKKLSLAGMQAEIISLRTLSYKFPGCISCRSCQKKSEYGCVIEDDASVVLQKMLQADVLLMATPLYFFTMSAQLKVIVDRMFSLYKWDNAAGTMKTPLKGKRLAVIGSAFEDEGLDVLEAPFRLTAEYTGMEFCSLLVPNAGVSGDVVKSEDVRGKVAEFAKKISKPLKNN